jgi:hypothetical protein
MFPEQCAQIPPEQCTDFENPHGSKVAKTNAASKNGWPVKQQHSDRILIGRLPHEKKSATIPKIPDVAVAAPIQHGGCLC